MERKIVKYKRKFERYNNVITLIDRQGDIEVTEQEFEIETDTGRQRVKMKTYAIIGYVKELEITKL